MSSPVSVSSTAGVDPLGSDVVSLLSDESDKGKPKASIRVLTCSINYKPAAATTHHIPEDTEGNQLFAYGDGDFNLCVGGTVFHTHKYLLKRFSTLKRLIEQKADDSESEGLPLEHDATDFLNTFKIMYASPIEGVPDFDTATLVSALRTATKYEHPALRTFAIERLEKVQLSAIERIRIAREFEFTPWEAPAYEELCGRDDPITEQEADVLGMSAFVLVAKIREKEQRRRGYAAKVQEEELEQADEQDEITQPSPSLDEQNPTSIAPEPASRREATETTASLKKTTRKAHSKATETPAHVEITDADKTDNDKLMPSFKPDFIRSSPRRPEDYRENTSSSKALQYEIPGCQCRSRSDRNTYNSAGSYMGVSVKCRCTTPPCVANALAQLQTSQVAHATSIAQLKSAFEGVKSGLSPLDEDSVISEPTVPTTVHVDVCELLVGKHRKRTDEM